MILTFAAILAAAGQDLEACRKIADPAERLACYDKAAAAPAPEAPAAPAPAAAPTPDAAPAPLVTEAPVPVPTPEEEAKKEKERRFGLPFRRDKKDKPKEERADFDGIVSDVDSIARVRYGALRVTLTNGQIWQQLDGDDRESRIPSRIEDQVATVERAALGSYRMTIKPARLSMRVRRVE